MIIQSLYSLCYIVTNNFVVPSIAPSGAPEMFERVTGQRQVEFSWSPPPVTQRNGVITSYTLSCSPSPSSLPLFPSQSGPLIVTGFSPNTLYSCSVVATNSQGSGPPATTTFTTQQDCNLYFLNIEFDCIFLCIDTFFQLRLSGLLSPCIELVVSIKFIITVTV